MDPFTVPVASDNQPSPPHSPPRPSVAAASPAASAAPPTLNNPPPYAEMIYAAITALKKKDGSSKIAIGKYIEQSYSNLPMNHSTLLTQHLQRLKNTGHLLMVKKSYKLPRCDAPVPETNNNNQDNAVNISSSAHGSKTSRGRGRPPKSLNAAKAQPVTVPVGLVDQTPHLTPAKRRRGRQIGGPPVELGGRADAAVPKLPKLPKLKRRTKRPVGRPRKVQVQAQQISDALDEAKANVADPEAEVQAQAQAQAQPILTVPKPKRRTKRPVGRPKKAPISYAFGEANPVKNVGKRKGIGTAAAAAASTAMVKPVGRPMGRPVGRPNPTKSNSRTGSPVGRPRKDEVASQRESLENDVRCLRGELQQVRDERDRLESRVQALTAELDLNECQLTAANDKSTALAAELDLKESQLTVANEKSTALAAELTAANDKLKEAELLRKKFHNTIVGLKGNIRVMCRVRPLVPLDGLGQEASPLSYPTSMDLCGRSIDVLQNGKKTRFIFNKVFRPVASQQDVFGEVSELVQSALDGHKVCIFAYGQTGSGKTHTMMGRPESPEHKGLIPRSLEQIFQTSQWLSVQGWKHRIQASILEVYNNKIKDLMVVKQSADLTIKRDGNGDVYVDGLSVTDLGSIEQISSLLQQATQARSVSATRLNEQSSRSHMVLTVRIFGVHEGTGQQVQGVLNLIDLAGSERIKKSGAVGKQKEETQAINLSLLHLSELITALVKKQDYIPYRDSTLTSLLQPYLNKYTKTLMVVNIAPNPSSVGESVNSMRFAAVAFGSEVRTVHPASLLHGDSSRLKSPRPR